VQQKITSEHRSRRTPIGRSRRDEIVAEVTRQFRNSHLQRSLFLQIIKRLEADGWTLRSVRGSHHVFTHPAKPGHICVPHPKQGLGVGLVHKLMKQAGLK
jgi:predicted RNA binding protein YcfA (HicA-like mRNA interferase family)